MFVRLDKEPYRSVRTHLLTICSWSSYRDVERMEREFARLPFLMYGPVYWQLLLIARAVNAKRRRAGFLPIDYECIPKKLRVTKVYVEAGRDAA